MEFLKIVLNHTFGYLAYLKAVM